MPGVAGSNVTVRVLWVRGWPLPFLVTTQPVEAGQELWYDYGNR